MRPSASAVASNIVSVVFGGQGAGWSLVAAGKVRALALTGAQRSPTHPDVPTIAEAGVPGYEIADWAGMLAPAGTPQPIIDTLNAEIGKALADRETQEKLFDNYVEKARAPVLTGPCRAHLALADGRLYGREARKLVCWNLKK